jgi:hypothetical protein
MEAPDLGDVHLVFGREPPGNLNRARGHVQMKGSPSPAKVRPLRHRFEMIDRFGGFHFDRSHQPVPTVRGSKYKIRKELNLSNPNRSCLRFADVRHYLDLALQAHHEEPNNAVVLELLAHGADEDRAHGTSRRRRTNRLDSAGPAIIVRSHNPAKLYTAGVQSNASCLDGACLYPSE